MKNPFIAGNWVRGSNFFGRQKLINEILEGDRHFIWVAGTRRLGKTSLLTASDPGSAVEALGGIGPAAKEAVPALVKAGEVEHEPIAALLNFH